MIPKVETGFRKEIMLKQIARQAAPAVEDRHQRSGRNRSVMASCSGTSGKKLTRWQ